MRKDLRSSLDFLNFSVAGMRDGLGPLLTVFLIQRAKLGAADLAWVLAVPSMATLVCQVPVGLAYDRVRDRRLLLALGALLMGAVAFAVSRVPGFHGLLAAQAGAGAAMALINVGLPALCLQMAGGADFGPRLARNEVFSKIGNFAALGLTGVLAQRIGLHWMFYVLYGLAALVATSALLVPKPRVATIADPAAETSGGFRGARASLRSTRFLSLLGLLILFFFSGSALLFIFEQRFVPRHPQGGAGYISGALTLTQIVIFFGSIYLARKKELGDPLRWIALGFGLLLAEALVYAADFELVSLGIAQVLDGVVTAILLIVPARALAALDERHFNVLSGVLGTAVSLGASASTVAAGYLIQHRGHEFAFLTFAVTAAIGLGATAVLAELVRMPRLPIVRWRRMAAVAPTELPVRPSLATAEVSVATAS